MKQRFVIRMLALILAGMCGGLAFADGATNARERFFLKRQNCPWTDEMGKFIFECVKKNDGFNAHWCHNEALDQFCPVDESAAVDAKAAAKAKRPKRRWCVRARRMCPGARSRKASRADPGSSIRKRPR